jgi:hypothetical protein
MRFKKSSKTTVSAFQIGRSIVVFGVRYPEKGLSRRFFAPNKEIREEAG